MLFTKGQLQQELSLEESMFLQGKTRFMTNLQKMKDGDNESSTGYGKVLLKRGIAPVSEGIREFLSAENKGKPGAHSIAAKYIRDMDADVLAFITLRCIMDTLTRENTLQHLALTIGRAIETEKRLANLEEMDKDRYDMTQKYIQGHNNRRYRSIVLRYAFGKSELVDFEPWPSATCVHIGSKLITVAGERTGLFTLELKGERKSNKANTVYYVRPTPITMSWINEVIEQQSVMNPAYLPTIIPPKPWCGAAGGGYYYDKLKCLSLVKTFNHDYLKFLDSKIEKGECSKVLKAINALQDTPWHINRRVFEVLDHLWNATDGDFADLPPREGYSLPLCPVCGADITETASAGIRHACLDTLTDDDLKAWRREAAEIREKNVSNMSRRLGIAKTLHIAGLYLHYDKFYFPYQLDFRGRIYAVPPYLNPQGTGIAKALLEFAEGKPLGTVQAARWLAIQGANTWGNDKTSLDERCAWVHQNQDAILSCAEDPYDNLWWTEADDPWGFLAFCFEWQGYIREGLSWISHLPIAMDGTCNGLQIFSLILRDEVGGHAVNLTPEDTPQDIYALVADKVIVALEDISKQPVENNNVFHTGKDGIEKLQYNKTLAARLLLSLEINRKTTKRQVMTLPYGSTFESCKDYTRVWLKEALTAHGYTSNTIPYGYSLYHLGTFLAQYIWDAIGMTVIKAREAMRFLQETCLILNSEDSPIRWTTPVGLPVLQNYKKVKSSFIKTRVGDKIVQLSLCAEIPASLDKHKQRNGISPNFVHSLDASALMETVCRCVHLDVHSFAMIHDSYGTHATDCPALAKTLREVFIDLFGHGNLLESWSKEVLASIPVETLAKKDLPSLPEMGSLKIDDVRRSLFFFA